MSSPVRPAQVPEYAGRIVPPWGALGWMPKLFWNYIKQYFGYHLDFVGTNVVPASGAVSLNIQIQGDAYFAILYATLIETDTNNTTRLPFSPLMVQLQETGNGQSFFSTQGGAHVDEVFGDGFNPGIFAMPYILKPNATLQVTLTNLEAVQRNVRCTFHGFKLVPGSDEDTGDQYRGF